VTPKQHSLLKERFCFRCGAPTPTKPAAATPRLSQTAVQSYSSAHQPPAPSSQCDTQPLTAEGCVNSPCSQKEFLLMGKSHFLPNSPCLHLSSPLCLVSPFSEQQNPLLQCLACPSAGAPLPSPAPEKIVSHTPKPTLLEAAFSHTMDGFFHYGGEEWGKMVCTRASFHTVFSLVAKLFPNSPSPSPCPAQRLHTHTHTHPPIS